MSFGIGNQRKAGQPQTDSSRTAMELHGNGFGKPQPDPSEFKGLLSMVVIKILATIFKKVYISVDILLSGQGC